MAMIKDRISKLQSNISLICEKLGRNPQDITLVAVTKFATVDKIKEAVSCGLSNFGENKVQQARDKFPQLGELRNSIQCHMIGHLQTNKVKMALELFDLIQSVDSLKLAEEINKQAKKNDRIVEILVQVNTAGEFQKFGADEAEALTFIEKILDFKQILVRGLMTMAPFTDNKDIVRNCFQSLRKLGEQASEKFKGFNNFEMKYLSMGMTDDYEIALEEGSNMVRIGRAIFQDD